jgi:hypothetical protein
LLQKLRREYFGLVLYPLAWVSHHWQQAVTVFADLDRFPRRQVFRLRHLRDDLIGYPGAAEFNFLESRFRGNGAHKELVAAEVGPGDRNALIA